MDACVCDVDGFCARYQRNMTGRFREVCAGINCDLGTSAAFRAQWAAEAKQLQPSTPSATAPIQLLLRTDQAPGDAVAMTAAIYSLHRAHPAKYLTAVDSLWPEVFLYNPDVVGSASALPRARPLHMHYPAIHACNDRGIHFMQGWCEHLGAALGVNVPLLTDKPHIYFPDSADSGYAFLQGSQRQGQNDDFWLICSGGKRDFTAKLWGYDNYQDVVDELRGRVRFVQVGAGTDEHPRLRGAGDMVGRTTLRGLFDLVRQSRGVVCGVSLLMHVAAALDKPAVVIAGGREPVQWNAYPQQHYLHTVGALPCTSTQGHVGRACWRSRVMPLGDNAALDANPCERPREGLPECMWMIMPEMVAGLVRMLDNQ